MQKAMDLIPAPHTHTHTHAQTLTHTHSQESSINLIEYIINLLSYIKTVRTTLCNVCTPVIMLTVEAKKEDHKFDPPSTIW